MKKSLFPGGFVPFSLATLLASTVASAQAPGAGWVGQVKVSRGIAHVERAGQRLPALVGLRLRENDSVLTEANGAVGIMFNDNSMLSLGPNGEVVLERYAYDPTTYLGAFDAYVKRGAVSIESGNLASGSAEAMRIKTPQAEVRGQTRSFAINVEGK